MTKNVKIDDRVWRALLSRLRDLNGKYAKVGIVGSAASEDHDGSTNAEIAAALHFGTSTIPARPFITQAMFQRRGELARLQGQLAKQFIYGKMSAEQALGLLGAWGAGAIKATITSTGHFAPNAPATIARKKSSRPLVDTGQLVGAVSWIVVA